jgi:hypothetical protein
VTIENLLTFLPAGWNNNDLARRSPDQLAFFKASEFHDRRPKNRPLAGQFLNEKKVGRRLGNPDDSPNS